MKIGLEDHLKLDQFIRNHYAELYATALKFLKSAECAKDIVQNVIIKYWENQEKYHIKDLDSFLFIMVKNEALNHLRSQRREKERYTKLEIKETEEPDIFNLFLEEETNIFLLHAIKQLPQQSKQVIKLSLSGLENREIAELLGISVNTIKTLKYGAIKRLKEYFQQLDL